MVVIHRVSLKQAVDRRIFLEVTVYWRAAPEMVVIQRGLSIRLWLGGYRLWWMWRGGRRPIWLWFRGDR